MLIYVVGEDFVGPELMEQYPEFQIGWQQINTSFQDSVEDIQAILMEIEQRAIELSAKAIIFQHVTPNLTAALLRFKKKVNLQWGVMVNENSAFRHIEWLNLRQIHSPQIATKGVIIANTLRMFASELMDSEKVILDGLQSGELEIVDAGRHHPSITPEELKILQDALEAMRWTDLSASGVNSIVDGLHAIIKRVQQFRRPADVWEWAKYWDDRNGLMTVDGHQTEALWWMQARGALQLLLPIEEKKEE